MRQCPACGSLNFITVNELNSFDDVYGNIVNFKEKISHCSDCNTSGDFFNENDPVRSDAVDRLNVLTSKHIIEKFIDGSKKFSSIELGLSLKQGTLRRIRDGCIQPDRAMVTLLHLIYTYPWLIDVNFDSFVLNKPIKAPTIELKDSKLILTPDKNVFILESLDISGFDSSGWWRIGIYATKKSAYKEMLKRKRDDFMEWYNYRIAKGKMGERGRKYMTDYDDMEKCLYKVTIELVKD